MTKYEVVMYKYFFNLKNKQIERKEKICTFKYNEYLKAYEKFIYIYKMKSYKYLDNIILFFPTFYERKFIFFKKNINLKSYTLTGKLFITSYNFKN